MMVTTESFCSDLMTSSLSSRGFTVFAHALHAHNVTTTAARLTFLAPPDSALVNRVLNNDSLHGHITAAGALPYQSLLALPPNTALPTLHHNTTLVVGSDGERVSLNNVLVVVPNLYIDGLCAVHGVDEPLVPTPLGVDDHSLKPRTNLLPSPGNIGARLFSKYDWSVRRKTHS
ncbi:hypothetical protein K2173_019434 [Erythroxylum novogranatense]|uniref:FAS1 domain-containing protein n=1 Tax=Erythroxylum novogranatense TaxID=1862640 RepID=A0AAV8UBE1_9ROSI|nr:hypothetical protein K2173_019434 [Erythroxylum novogranatense]